MQDISTGKEICIFLEKKLSLFKKYLSITENMKESLSNNERGNLGSLVSERQNCINKIDKINLSMKKITKLSSEKLYTVSDKFAWLIECYFKGIRNIMETIPPVDRELMAMVREEADSIKTELLNMRNVRQAAQGYKNERLCPPRFLDMKR